MGPFLPSLVCCGGQPDAAQRVGPLRLFADKEMELEENLEKITKSWRKRRDSRGEAMLRHVLAGSDDDDSSYDYAKNRKSRRAHRAEGRAERPRPRRRNGTARRVANTAES